MHGISSQTGASRVYRFGRRVEADSCGNYRQKTPFSERTEPLLLVRSDLDDVDLH